jgi:signal peptidase I
MLYNLTKVGKTDFKRVRLLNDLAVEIVRESLSAGGSITVQIDSSSMVPWVVPGEKVVFSAPDTRLLPGAVVIAIGRFGPLTHRVVAVKYGRYLLKGDAIPRFDGWFSRDRIIANAAAVKRESGESKTDTFINRTRVLAVALLSRFQGRVWPGSPFEGAVGLPGRALFYIYRLLLALLFTRFKL